MGSRYLIICKPIDRALPGVVAETPDHDWAEDERSNGGTTSHSLVTRRGWILTSPRRWMHGIVATTLAHLGATVLEGAETVVWDAVEAAGGEWEAKGDWTDTKHGVDLEVLEAFHEIQARYVGESVRFYRHGKPEAGAQLARLIAQDTSAWKGGSV